MAANGVIVLREWEDKGGEISSRQKKEHFVQQKRWKKSGGNEVQETKECRKKDEETQSVASFAHKDTPRLFP